MRTLPPKATQAAGNTSEQYLDFDPGQWRNEDAADCVVLEYKLLHTSHPPQCEAHLSPGKTVHLSDTVKHIDSKVRRVWVASQNLAEPVCCL